MAGRGEKRTASATFEDDSSSSSASSSSALSSSSNDHEARAKQLKSFLQLYKGRVEIEEIIADKLSIAIDKEEQSIGLDEVERLDAQIKELEGALKNEEIQMPQGMSTREARFGALP